MTENPAEQRIFRAAKLGCMIPRWWISVIIHLSGPIDCMTPRVSPNVNYGLWVITMCQYRFINCNKCTTLLGVVDNGEGYACVEAGGKWEIPVPSAPFFCEPKTALKKIKSRGTWLAQSVEHATLNLRVLSSRIMLGIEIT